MTFVFLIAFVVAGAVAWAFHTALHRHAIHIARGFRRGPGLRVPPARVDPRTLDAETRRTFYVELATTWTAIFLVLTLAGLLALSQGSL